MNKRYLAKIIAKDKEGLGLISACCSQSRIKISNIKYLKQNKILLLSLNRIKKESNNNELVNSIIKFDYIDFVKSKNIDQKNVEQELELLTIDCVKTKDKFEIILTFSKKNTYITLFTEVIEVNLEDQNDKI